MKRQAMGIAIAAEMDTSSEVFETEASLLDTNGMIMREAMVGVIKISTEDAAALKTFRKSVSALANSVKTARRSIRDLRRKTRWFRKLNLSMALNRSAERQREAVDKFEKTQTGLLKTAKQVDSLVKRKLLLRFVQRSVLHRAGSQPR